MHKNILIRIYICKWISSFASAYFIHHHPHLFQQPLPQLSSTTNSSTTTTLTFLNPHFLHHHCPHFLQLSLPQLSPSLLHLLQLTLPPPPLCPPLPILHHIPLPITNPSLTHHGPKIRSPNPTSLPPLFDILSPSTPLPL